MCFLADMKCGMTTRSCINQHKFIVVCVCGLGWFGIELPIAKFDGCPENPGQGLLEKGKRAEANWCRVWTLLWSVGNDVVSEDQSAKRQKLIVLVVECNLGTQEARFQEKSLGWKS